MKKNYNERIKCKELINGVQIQLPSDENWFLVIGLIPFILVWLLTEIFIIPGLILNIHNNVHLLFWFCGWSGAGIFAIRMWLWHALGKIVISIEDGKWTIYKKWDIFLRAKSFQVGYYNSVRISFFEPLNNQNFIK